MNGYDMNGWGWAGMTLMALILIAILALVWVMVRRVGDLPVHAASAREQLDARLARGEIDTREYKERLEALRGDRSAG